MGLLKSTIVVKPHIYISKGIYFFLRQLLYNNYILMCSGVLALNLTDFNFDSDIMLITDILNVSKEQLFSDAGIVKLTTREDVDKLFDYCYNKGIYINDIKWQEYKEMFDYKNTLVLCHGSRSGLVGKIDISKSSSDSDFGKGFYLGQTLKQAGMFVSDSPDSSVYLFKFNTQRLKRATFKVGLEWLFCVIYYRNLLPQYNEHPKVLKAVNKVNQCDYVVSPIADNRITELVEAFANGDITDDQAMYALSATHLGYQYVIKNQAVVDTNLSQLDNCYLCPVEKSFYNISNKVESNTSLNKAILAKVRYKESGKYIHQLLS